MYEKISTNVRVIGYIKSEMEQGKTEFTIIERKTINGKNYYKGLLDNGTVCPVIKENGEYIADNTINKACKTCENYKKCCTGTFDKNWNDCIYKPIFESKLTKLTPLLYKC